MKKANIEPHCRGLVQYCPHVLRKLKHGFFFNQIVQPLRPKSIVNTLEDKPLDTTLGL